jgi:hypothetical protein
VITEGTPIRMQRGGGAAIELLREEVVKNKTRLMRIGTYLVKKGLLTLDQANEIMREQSKRRGMSRERFGRIAVNKGYISEEAMTKAFLEKSREDSID